MREIRTNRLILRSFKESDYDDLFEYLLQLEDDEFEGYPGLTYEKGIHRVFAECDPRNIPSWKLLEKNGLQCEAYFKQNIYFHKDTNGNPIWKDTFAYAITAEDYCVK